MGTKNFTDGTTVVDAEWLNDVDALVWDIFNGSTTAAQARTALGVAIGSDVQAYDATLASLSALGYENSLDQPVIRLWNDTRHVDK